jgi:hypothetical protein
VTDGRVRVEAARYGHIEFPVTDVIYGGDRPSFAMTRENALALADAIRELCGTKPDETE